VTEFLGLDSSVAAALTEFADKGEAAMTIPKEPLQYRFQEILYVYGRTMKELIEEKFGAGIMSAIDFTMDIERGPDLSTTPRHSGVLRLVLRTQPQSVSPRFSVAVSKCAPAALSSCLPHAGAQT